MRVEILCTGDEILSGKTINTNYSHISRRLGELGLDVHWGTTVGDHRDALLQAFRQAGERSDAVIVNGGLGPTVDDLSQEIAALAAGVELELSEYWLERMTQSYARRGRVMPANNKAHYPELETKLAARAEDEATLAAKLAPVEAEVRKRLGNFIVAEDDQSLESVVLAKLKAGGFTLAVAEGVTAGTLAARLAARAEADGVFRHGTVDLDLHKLPSPEKLRTESGASHGLRVAVSVPTISATMPT